MPERVNAADHTAVRARQRTEKELREQEQNELRDLLKQPEFRRYIWRLIGRCKLFESPGSTNGSVQSVNIGRQDVGRELWAELESAEPLVIPQMMAEHFKGQT
jgi:hypothetical protein